MGLYFWLLAAKPFIYLSGGFMRFAYRFLRYYRYYSGKRLVFDLCLIAVILSFSFYFLDKSSMIMIDSLTNNLKTEVSKLKTVKKPYAHDISSNSSSEVILPSRIPKSCFSSDTRGCVCYDQYTTIIRDFPVDRCHDIVNGFARF